MRQNRKKSPQVEHYLAWEGPAATSLGYLCSGAGVALAACIGNISDRQGKSILLAELVGAISGVQFMERVLHLKKRQAFAMVTFQ